MSNFEIAIHDYSIYDPPRSHNGGAYAFHEKATVQNGQIVDGHHWTSADFDYCRYCGSFERNLQEHEEHWHPDQKYQATFGMEAAIREADEAVETGQDANKAVSMLFGDGYILSVSVAP